MQTRVMMQNTSEIIFDVMELVVAFHTRVIQNLSYQKIYKTNTTKQVNEEKTSHPHESLTLEIFNNDIKSDIGSSMTNMTIIINCHPANIDIYLVWGNALKCAFAAG